MHSGNLFNHQTGFQQSSRRISILQYKALSRIIGISMTLLGLRSGNLFRTTYSVLQKEMPQAKKDLCIESILRLPTSVHFTAIFKEFSPLQHIITKCITQGSAITLDGYCRSKMQRKNGKPHLLTGTYTSWSMYVHTSSIWCDPFPFSVSSWRH